MGHRIIQSTDELDELCQRAEDAGRIGIDTEFLWERTYAPQICLVQINVDGDVAIADPLDGIELEPLADVIDDPEVEVVMHAPHADLVAFALRYDTRATRVFDTQIAAGFVGLSAGLSYERLVAEATGEQVQPSESFSDWSRRPLNANQLVYAAEDVEYLFGVADEIERRLQKFGRASWAAEEMLRRFGDPDRMVTPPDDAWRKVGRRGKLRPKELAVLREIAAWRENNARTRDIPTSWVMKDPSLVELARRKPTNAKDLTRVRGVDGSMRKQDINGLLEAVERGLGGEPIEEGEPPARGVRKRVTIAKGLTAALMRARCEAEDIAPELVGTSQDIEDLIAWVATHPDDLVESALTEEGDPALLKGWRAEFGRELVDLVEGRLQLQLSNTAPYLVVSRP